jgi:hypothetical protein
LRILPGSIGVKLRSSLSHIHPVSVMGGADARPRKRHVGFALIVKKFCRSAIDPKPDISRKGESIYAQ